jgi:hypothetical protein
MLGRRVDRQIRVAKSLRWSAVAFSIEGASNDKMGEAALKLSHGVIWLPA